MGPRLVKIPLLVELCAGTAALSLRLERSKARPPVSRMGAKTGYADAILSRMGLHPGQGAEHYLLCEPDDGCRLLLEAYRDRALALASAEHIRGWKDEEPRALWERLREEGPAKCPPVDPREVARWATVQGWAYAGTGLMDPAKAGLGNIDSKGRRWGVSDQAWIATRLTTLPTLPATITDDARTVDPREVARWCFIRRLTNGVGDGFAEHGGGYNPKTGERWAWRWDRNRIPLEDLPTLPATITDDARTVDPPQLPAGSWVYIDPPYVGTTGYGHDLGRPEVIALARRWREAGAHVAVSEAEPIAELIADGWHAHELSRERVGQKRTFSKQQREVLTISRAPRGQLGLL
jgi:hypothetical protein